MPRILITRVQHQASALADALRARGLEPLLIPTIELAPPTTFAPLDDAIASLETFHWLLFTSANAVEAFATRLALKGTGFSPSVQSTTDRVPQGFSLGSHSPEEWKGALAPGACLIAAIGPATARAITELLGTKPTLMPPKSVAESLAEALLPHAKQTDGTPTRFLLIRAETARDILPETLRKAGGEVTIAPAYRTVIPQDSLPLIRTLFHSPETYPDAITFTSSSTVTNLMALLAAADLSLPRNIPRISIGPITSQTLRDNNIPPHAESSDPTIESLVQKIAESIA
jgi:uroporphyrinogen-III synthase